MNGDLNGASAAFCAICRCNVEPLEECKPDCCEHKFCLICLKRWIQRRPVCPICIRQVGAIVRVTDNCVMKSLSVNSPHYLSDIRIPTNVMPTWFRNNPLRFLYFVGLQSTSYPIREASFRLQIYEICRMENGRRVPITTHLTALVWRRLVYINGFYARPLFPNDQIFQDDQDFSGNHSREVDRLCAFFNREVAACLREDFSVVTMLKIEFRYTLHDFSLSSNHFRALLFPHFQNTTEHLLHELKSFAVSNMDVVEYDETVVYCETRAEALANEDGTVLDAPAQPPEAVQDQHSMLIDAFLAETLRSEESENTETAENQSVNAGQQSAQKFSLVQCIRNVFRLILSHKPLFGGSSNQAEDGATEIQANSYLEITDSPRPSRGGLNSQWPRPSAIEMEAVDRLQIWPTARPTNNTGLEASFEEGNPSSASQEHGAVRPICADQSQDSL